MQFCINTCTMGGANYIMVAMALCEGILYQILKMKVRGNVDNFMHLHVGGSPTVWWNMGTADLDIWM